MAEDYPEFELREKCGVFGAFGVDDAAMAAMRAMVALNHRGQEGAGLATYDGVDYHFNGNGGLVREILTRDVLAGMPGRQTVGQTRYGTSGSEDDPHVQPIFNRQGNFWFAENGNQTDVSPIVQFLIDQDIGYNRGDSDSELKTKVIGHYMLQGLSLDRAFEQAAPLFTGAYSSVMMDEKSLVAARGPLGIRPLVLGRKGAGWMVASETCAITAAGGEIVRDVEPGEMIIVTENGFESRRFAGSDLKLDIFELIYFAREDSEMFGRSVFSIRQDMGRQLAAEFKKRKIAADMVVPVPNSAIPAALGFAEASGLPYMPAILKSSYIHRTFIGATEQIRREDRDMKLSFIPGVVKGKRIILADDSIVRANTQKGVVQKARASGAAEVHVVITSPPIEWPDFYGINTPDRSELAFIKYGGLEGVRQYIGADSLTYLSLDGLVRATAQPKERFCLSAFTGEYPLDIGYRAAELALKLSDHRRHLADREEDPAAR